MIRSLCERATTLLFSVHELLIKPFYYYHDMCPSLHSAVFNNRVSFKALIRDH